MRMIIIISIIIIITFITVNIIIILINIFHHYRPYVHMMIIIIIPIFITINKFIMITIIGSNINIIIFIIIMSIFIVKVSRAYCGPQRDETREKESETERSEDRSCEKVIGEIPLLSDYATIIKRSPGNSISAEFLCRDNFGDSSGGHIVYTLFQYYEPHVSLLSSLVKLKCHRYSLNVSEKMPRPGPPDVYSLQQKGKLNGSYPASRKHISYACGRSCKPYSIFDPM